MDCIPRAFWPPPECDKNTHRSAYTTDDGRVTAEAGQESFPGNYPGVCFPLRGGWAAVHPCAGRDRPPDVNRAFNIYQTENSGVQKQTRRHEK